MTDRQKFEITGKITKEKSEEFHKQLKKISDSITFASTFYEDGYLKLDGECDDGEQVGEVYELGYFHFMPFPHVSPRFSFRNLSPAHRLQTRCRYSPIFPWCKTP